MEQHRQEDVLLNDVGWKAKARPVQPHVKVAVAVEVIRAWTTYSSSNTIAASFRAHESHECLGTSMPFRQGTLHVGGCQNYAILEPYYNTAPNIYGTQKGTRILTTTHIGMTWRTFKDVEVPHGMNDNKEDQQDSAACQAKSII